MIINDPTPRLKDWLNKAGRPVDRIVVRNDQFGRFLEETHNIYPHLDLSERLDLAAYNCVCHPGRMDGEEPPYSEATPEKSIATQGNALLEPVHTSHRAPTSPHYYDVDRPSKWSRAWTIGWQVAVLILLYLLLATHAHSQVPHDPLIIRTKDQGVTLTTRPAGLLELNCASGMSCSQVGNTFTLTSTGGGAGDDVQVNAVSSTNINFNNTLPAAPANAVNIKWQLDTVPAPDNASGHLLLSDVSTATFGGGSGFGWTFNASGGTDPVLTFGNGTINASTGTLQQGGVPVSLVDGIDCSSPATLTLDVAGAITTSGSACYLLDTFSAASTDDLETVNCNAGERFIFAPASAARTVVVKAGVGINILADFSLDGLNDSMMVWCKAANTIAELSRVSGGT